mmetsp:Transcript_24599/g.27999  ORF Transcript_24599/g.27999 Transcript_24599/m.27999 type:complete len:127 (+) Transcript_24599:3023-3403(+)
MNSPLDRIIASCSVFCSLLFSLTFEFRSASPGKLLPVDKKIVPIFTFPTSFRGSFFSTAKPTHTIISLTSPPLSYFFFDSYRNILLRISMFYLSMKQNSALPCFEQKEGLKGLHFQCLSPPLICQS